MTPSNGKSIGRTVTFGIPLAVFLSLAACVIDDGPTGLLIVQDQWLDTGTGSVGCKIPGAPTPDRRGSGVLDVTVLDRNNTRYYLYPVVENLLDPFSGLEGSSASGGVEEKNNIVMTSFHVKLDVATGAGASFAWDAGCPAEFDVPVGSYLLGPGGTVSYMVEIVRPCNAAPLFQYLQANQSVSSLEVTATVRAKGHLGSWDIESPPFKFPVEVCYGCLQSGYSDPAAAQFGFPAVAMCSDLAVNPYTGNPCNPAQDTPILCCALGVDAQGHATGVQCPAVPTGTAH
ncbi:MAG TPA: hypothetical protein VJ801_20225 [Polyangia bacterium]|jgi:hypothetical protein|nr:hypothetical protein [Polyangia bacterium]